MTVAARAPHLALAVFGFVLIGPVALGVVWGLWPLLYGGTMDARSFRTVPEVWWRLVAGDASAWVLTLVPTTFAGVLYWLMLNGLFRLVRFSGIGRARVVTSSIAIGGIASIASWPLLALMLAGRSIPVGLLHHLGVIATGLIVGAAMSTLCRNERPNDTVEWNAKLPPI